MPKLLPEILENIYYKLFKDTVPVASIYGFALSGSESFKILEGILSTVKEVSVDDNGLTVKLRGNHSIQYHATDDLILHFLKCVGNFADSLELDYNKHEIIRFSAPLITAICEAQKLSKLSVNDCTSIFDSKRMIEACSDSLKTFTSDVTSFFCLDTSRLNLDLLHLYSLEHTEFRSIVKRKCCKTATLSLAFLQHLDDEASIDPEYLEWKTLINVFEGIQNPTLETVKKLKLYLTVDGIDDDIRLEEVLLNISEGFPFLEKVEIYENDSYSALEQIEDMLFVVDGTKLCYHILLDQILDSNFHFGVDVKWNVDFEGFFTESDCDTFIERCKQVFDDDFEFLDTEKKLIIRKTEIVAQKRALNFVVNVCKLVNF